ncbi:MAG: bifunctional aspartate kinase/homoserine dehydrogenase I [Deltaproteobacteria bacterium]|nr:bifunctional aspartate kinase/homoserine dehydrogenase I [Deltaproteobacteria bacterium]
MLNWVTHKFGGTSVASAERYRQVAQILRAETAQSKSPANAAVIVSAMSKVTDALLELVDLARKRDESYLTKLEALRARHLQASADLLDAQSRQALDLRIEADLKDIAEVLRGILLSRNASDRTSELISGYGEIWSAQLLNAHLKSQGAKSTWLDAREVLVVTPGESSVVVDFAASQAKLDRWLDKNSAELVVVTGFIASTPEGIPTTLKRNGSDYSASIFGSLLKARIITIWTDVDGVLSADPRLVPEAVVLEDMSYDEATELAYFGAKVVHPDTMAPAISGRIPIYIRNTFSPQLPGTLIHERSKSSATVKGFAAIDKMALVNVEGTGMIGVPGVAQRLFGALREVGVSVVMISQASSEHSICFAVPQSQAALTRKTVEQAFFAELHHGQIQTIGITDDCSILAAVGDNMVKHPGVAGRFFGALGHAGVNIRAIAQGSSERNISVVVSGTEARKALRAAHAAFYLSNQTISVGLIGPGLIGATLLDQLNIQLERLRREYRIDFRVRGIMKSGKMLLTGSAEQQIDLKNWREALAASTTVSDLSRFVEHVNADYLPHAVLIDATAGDEMLLHYPEWLASGVHVITPNKKANTQSLAFYRKLRESARSANAHFLYETNVGAGLPIINTLRDLVQTGDKILQIDGVLSGTMSYIFNSFTGEKPFSEIVKEAKAKGYTEPDPRDDLSGMDVARKLVILAREIGMETEISDIEIESLVPAALQKGTAEEYLAKLPTHDAAMLALLTDARTKGQVLRYVGVVDSNGKAAVRLKTYPKDHAFAQIGGSNNIFAFTTTRYNMQPLIVQGPGAGPAVTAGGVFADLLRLSYALGAPL